MSKGDPNHCLDMMIPYINSLIIKMPPASRGASGRGLALRMLLPVGVVVAFVAHGALVRVPCHVCAHIVHAHDAQRTVLGSANVIVHVISAANAAAGAGGFSRVVVSGAHANIVTQRPPHVKGRRWKFEDSSGLTSHPNRLMLASRCPRPSLRGSCLHRPLRMPRCPHRAPHHPAPCAPRAWPRARAPAAPRTSGTTSPCRRARGGGSRRGSVRARGWWWGCSCEYGIIVSRESQAH